MKHHTSYIAIKVQKMLPNFVIVYLKSIGLILMISVIQLRPILVFLMNLVKHISIVFLLRKLKVGGPRLVNPGFLRAF